MCRTKQNQLTHQYHAGEITVKLTELSFKLQTVNLTYFALSLRPENLMLSEILTLAFWPQYCFVRLCNHTHVWLAEWIILSQWSLGRDTRSCPFHCLLVNHTVTSVSWMFIKHYTTLSPIDFKTVQLNQSTLQFELGQDSSVGSVKKEEEKEKKKESNLFR